MDVVSPIPILSVELIRDGKVAKRWDARRQTEFTAGPHESLPKGDHFYYLRVVLEGPLYLRRDGMPANLMPAFGPRAWSSPIWLTRADDG